MVRKGRQGGLLPSFTGDCYKTNVEEGDDRANLTRGNGLRYSIQPNRFAGDDPHQDKHVRPV
jgi:hypothetical protein